MDTRKNRRKGGGLGAENGKAKGGKHPEDGGGAAPNTTSSPKQSTIHALQGSPGQSSQGQSGPIQCTLMTFNEQREAQEVAEAEWSRPMIPEMTDAILERAVMVCNALFQKARRTSLTWEEEWTLVFFNSTIAAEIEAGGNRAGAECLRVRARQ